MQNQIINIFFMTISGTLQGIALEYMLEKNKRISKWMRLIYWTVLGLIPSMINVLVSSSSDTVALRNGVHWIMAIAAMFFFYTDPLWRRIIGILIVYFAMLCGELVLLLVVQFTNIDIQILFDKTRTISVFFVGLSTFITIIIISAIIIVWRKVFHKGHSMKYSFFFLLYTFNFICSIIIMEQEILLFDLSTKSGWTVVTSIVCQIALLVIMFSQSEKDTMEKQLTEEKQKKELERIHYQEVERRRKEIKEISQNNEKDILEVKNLLKENQSEEAEKELKNLLHRMEMTREYPYCGVPIINAILSEKQKECEKENIITEIDIALPEEVRIKQMDLCSVFSNLMDNAIRAGKQINGNAVIRLKTAASGEYLVIKCTNPSAKEPEKIPEGTGYGLKILKDIAIRYEGDFRTHYQEHEFMAQLSIKFR